MARLVRATHDLRVGWDDAATQRLTPPTFAILGRPDKPGDDNERGSRLLSDQKKRPGVRPAFSLAPPARSAPAYSAMRRQSCTPGSAGTGISATRSGTSSYSSRRAFVAVACRQYMFTK
jgi:hypothetical protein